MLVCHLERVYGNCGACSGSSFKFHSIFVIFAGFETITARDIFQPSNLTIQNCPRVERERVRTRAMLIHLGRRGCSWLMSGYKKMIWTKMESETAVCVHIYRDLSPRQHPRSSCYTRQADCVQSRQSAGLAVYVADAFSFCDVWFWWFNPRRFSSMGDNKSNLYFGKVWTKGRKEWKAGQEERTSTPGFNEG